MFNSAVIFYNVMTSSPKANTELASKDVVSYPTYPHFLSGNRSIEVIYVGLVLILLPVEYIAGLRSSFLEIRVIVSV